MLITALAKQAAAGAVPTRMLKDFAPVTSRRDSFTPDEQGQINAGENQWLPKLIQTDATAIPDLMASPGRQAALAGLAGGGVGAAAGGLIGKATGHAGAGAAIGGLGLGALSALLRGFGQYHHNANLEESMRRLPVGATKRDLDTEEMVRSAINDRFKEAARTCSCGTAMRGAWCPACKKFDWAKEAAARVNRIHHVRGYKRRPPQRSKGRRKQAGIFDMAGRFAGKLFGLGAKIAPEAESLGARAAGGAARAAAPVATEAAGAAAAAAPNVAAAVKPTLGRTVANEMSGRLGAGAMGAGAAAFDPNAMGEQQPGQSFSNYALNTNPNRLKAMAGGFGAGLVMPAHTRRAATGYGLGEGADYLSMAAGGPDLKARYAAGAGAAIGGGFNLPGTKWLNTPSVSKGLGFVGANPALSQPAQWAQRAALAPRNLLTAGGYTAAGLGGIGAVVNQGMQSQVSQALPQIRNAANQGAVDAMSEIVPREHIERLQAITSVEQSLAHGQQTGDWKPYQTAVGGDAAFGVKPDGSVDPAAAAKHLAELKTGAQAQAGQAVMKRFGVDGMGDQVMKRLDSEFSEFGGVQGVKSKMAAAMGGAGGGLGGLTSTIGHFADSILGMFGMPVGKMSFIQKAITLLGGLGLIGGLLTGSGTASLLGGAALAYGIGGGTGMVPQIGQPQQYDAPAPPPVSLGQQAARASDGLNVNPLPISTPLQPLDEENPIYPANMSLSPVR